ncbi:MAG: ATP-binding cassette domain-containing protein [Pseudomonadota bacterium]
MTETPLLEAKALTKRFAGRRSFPWQSVPVVEAVKGVSIAVPRGVSLGIVGESGCGKSTLARMLVGLMPASSGSIAMDGQAVWAGDSAIDRRARQRIQMVFQDPLGSLNPRKTVRQLIEAPLIGLKHMTANDRRERVEALMDLVGLRPEFIHRHAHEFSGGQCQRIGIARALATEAEILVLDEPVSALDVSIQAQILKLLSDLRAQLGLTYLFISHDLSVVNHVCDEVAVMHFGEVVESGSTDKVLKTPSHAYTKSLLDAVPGHRLEKLQAAG